MGLCLISNKKKGLEKINLEFIDLKFPKLMQETLESNQWI